MITDELNLITPEEAAKRLGTSPAVLANWRSQGDRGPRFYRLGRKIAYAPADLVAWVQSCVVDPSAQRAGSGR